MPSAGRGVPYNHINQGIPCEGECICYQLALSAAQAARQPGHPINIEAQQRGVHPDFVWSSILTEIWIAQKNGGPCRWDPVLETLPGWQGVDPPQPQSQGGGNSGAGGGEGYPQGGSEEGHGGGGYAREGLGAGIGVSPAGPGSGGPGRAPGLAQRQQQVRAQRRYAMQMNNEAIAFDRAMRMGHF
ncbi:MAG: hypothetical protein LQ338_008187 [Usnochroma carphineum]|nr:MAG: hypothetical protein LQ338_008187 [Usnochroma carphineum]